MGERTPVLRQFRLPDVGEGLTEADILSWAVAPGDSVAVNQVLVEVETAKAAVELPSPFAGVVQALHVEAGQTVEVGRAIITIDVAPASLSADGDDVPIDETVDATAGVATDETLDATAGVATDASADVVDETPSSVLVGYGPRAGAPIRRQRLARRDDPSNLATQRALERTDGVTVGRPKGLATPPVRKLARSLGVELADIPATGPNGSVSRADVQRATTRPVPSNVGSLEDRIPVRGVRKHTAAAMVGSAFTAPHVSEFVTVDVTAMMELRQRIISRAEFAHIKITPLLFVAKAMLWAISRTPIVNSAWDEDAGEIVVKHYVNLGIAAATERGLLVPNIKDADAMTLRELATALAELTTTARAGRTSPAQLAQGTVTLTNIGVFGVDAGTPILNPGEAAIVAFGTVRRLPWVVDRAGVETIEPRWVTQLSLSFDHRVVDGEQGSRFLADVAAVLHDPGLALL